MWSTCLLVALSGCAPSTTARRQAPAAIAAEPAPLGQEPLPAAASRADREEALVSRYFHRVLAWRRLPDYLGRIADQIDPVVRAAAKQPQAENRLRQIARDLGVTVEQARQRWIALQDADLLLESFGDPEALSHSGAAGVAQWMPGTAAGAGIKLDAARSEQLTARIVPLERKVAWYAYVADPRADRSAPGCPNVDAATAAASLAAMRTELAALQAQRRQCDARYDPRAAIFAQTRYLLGIYPRFPSFDWLFQAYHGGEGGVARTLRTYVGGPWHGAAMAIRSGRRARITYEDVYFAVTPQSHAATFAYLYGRSDDHRHYWWKIRACMRVLALYQKSRDELTQAWLQSLPGRPQDGVWYPDAPKAAFQTVQDLQQALVDKRIRTVGQSDGAAPVPTPFGPPVDAWHSALRPAAQGLLRMIVAAYRHAGGHGPLNLGDMTMTMEDARRTLELPSPHTLPPDLDAQSPPGGGPPEGFDYHTSGMAFDILSPARPQDARILSWVLDSLAEHDVLSHADLHDVRLARSHVIPNPRYGAALVKIASGGAQP